MVGDKGGLGCDGFTFLFCFVSGSWCYGLSLWGAQDAPFLGGFVSMNVCVFLGFGERDVGCRLGIGDWGISRFGYLLIGVFYFRFFSKSEGDGG